jgi:hypothetical protein
MKEFLMRVEGLVRGAPDGGAVFCWIRSSAWGSKIVTKRTFTGAAKIVRMIIAETNQWAKKFSLSFLPGYPKVMLLVWVTKRCWSRLAGPWAKRGAGGSSCLEPSLPRGDCEKNLLFRSERVLFAVTVI